MLEIASPVRYTANLLQELREIKKKNNNVNSKTITKWDFTIISFNASTLFDI